MICSLRGIYANEILLAKVIWGFMWKGMAKTNARYQTGELGAYVLFYCTLLTPSLNIYHYLV
jgi:hypothetical protein